MLTLLTELKSFRVPIELVEETLKCKVTRDRAVYVEHAAAVEFIAMLNGEERINTIVLEDVWMKIAMDGQLYSRGGHFLFKCTDGEMGLDYGVHTLARHFLLIKGYVEDYPDEWSITVNHTMGAIYKAITTILEPSYADSDDQLLTNEVLYALQTLTPVTDLYYLLFDLTSQSPNFILGIVRNMSQDERSNVLKAYRLAGSEEVIGQDHRALPDNGEGIAIAFAFNRVVNYLVSKRIPDLCEKYPSFYFHCVFYYDDCFMRQTKPLLLTLDFNDDSGILSKGKEEVLIDSLLACARTGTSEDFGTILAMLGVKHPALGNEHITRYAPYQVLISRHDSLRVTLRELLIDRGFEEHEQSILGKTFPK